MRAVACDREWIFDAQRRAQLRAGIDAADLDGVHLGAIEQIAERRGQIVEMDGHVLIGRLDVAGRGDRIGDGLDGDAVGEVQGFAITVARQRRIDIGLDRGCRNIEGDHAIEVPGRRDGERLQQPLYLGRGTGDYKGAIGGARDRPGQRRVPLENGPGRQA